MAINLQEMRAVLEAMREDAEKAVERHNERVRGNSAVKAPDPMDESTQNLVVSIDFSMLNSSKKHLVAIDYAILRIENGTFGICRGCREPISETRLKAMPQSPLCLECEEQRRNSKKKDKSSYTTGRGRSYGNATLRS